MSWKDEYGDLQAWQEAVENFGGRLGPAKEQTLLDELGASNLGTAATLPTSQAVPVYPSSVLLAEMRLSRPICVDVNFSYGNIIFPPAIFTQPDLDVGDGYVEIEWGTPGAPMQRVRVDGGRGWRHPFVASTIRVLYIPQDPNGRLPPPGAQPTDLQISAMLSPSHGAASKLYKTQWFPTLIAPGVSGFVDIPDYAQDVWVNALNTGGAEINWTCITQASTAPGFLSLVASQSVGLAWFRSLSGRWSPVPQRGVVLALQNNDAEGNIGGANAVFRIQI
jgi:hypothetical protein